MGETTPAGATPVVTDATSVQTAAPQIAEPSATDYPDGMGDAGKQALDRMKASATEAKASSKEAEARARKAEKALADIQAASQSDTEKAIAAARKEGADEADAKWSARGRLAEVKRALAEAGCTSAGLAAKADEFAKLEFDEDGELVGLDKAVAAVKAATPILFGAKRPGSWDAGSPTALGSAPTFRASQLNDRAFYVANQAAIMQALRDGRVVDDNPK
jgi:hypothetical protein